MISRSLELRSLILLLSEEAFSIFSTREQDGAVCPAAQVTPLWHGHRHRGSSDQDPAECRYSQEAHTVSFLSL